MLTSLTLMMPSPSVAFKENGGVNGPIYVAPASYLFSSGDCRLPASELYIVVNGKLTNQLATTSSNHGKHSWPVVLGFLETRCTRGALPVGAGGSARRHRLQGRTRRVGIRSKGARRIRPPIHASTIRARRSRRGLHTDFQQSQTSYVKSDHKEGTEAMEELARRELLVLKEIHLTGETSHKELAIDLLKTILSFILAACY